MILVTLAAKAGPGVADAITTVVPTSVWNSFLSQYPMILALIIGGAIVWKVNQTNAKNLEKSLIKVTEEHHRYQTGMTTRAENFTQQISTDLKQALRENREVIRETTSTLRESNQMIGRAAEALARSTGGGQGQAAGR